MRRILLILSLVLSLVCIFAVGVSAEEISVTTGEELNSAISNFNSNGGDITLNIGGEFNLGNVMTITGNGNNEENGNPRDRMVWNFVGDVSINRKLLVNGPIDFEMKLNGYTYDSNVGNGGGSGYTAIEFKNAKLNAFVHGGTIYSTDVCLWVSVGTYTIEDMVIFGVEEAVYSSDRSDFSRLTIRRSTLSIVDVVDVAEGGLIEDCVITPCSNGSWYDFSTDAWAPNKAEEGGDFIIRNVKSLDGRALKLSLVGGYQRFYVYDSDYKTISCGKDSGGYGYVEYVESPTCQAKGKKIIYHDGTSTTEELGLSAHVLDEATINGIKYNNYFENGYLTGICKVCNEDATEENASCGALFESLGYSCITFGNTNAMRQCYIINKEAFDKYMAYNPEIEVGVVAAGNASGEAFVPSADNDKVYYKEIPLVNEYVDAVVKGVSGEFVDKCIVFCLYIKVGERVQFLDNGLTLSEVIGISYNGVAKLEK